MREQGMRYAAQRGILAAALLLILMIAAGTAAEPAHAATYPFRSTTIYADGTRTAKFSCNGMTGFCCEAGAYSTYSGSASLTRMSNTANAARCAYYYGYSKGWTSGTAAHKLARLLSWCMGNGTGGDYSDAYMKRLMEPVKKTGVPAGFECWLCKPSGSSRQDFIVWQYPKGKLRVVKKSADTAVSKKGKYTLAGITIKVYSDKACKNCVKTLTTKKNGSTGGAFSLHVGTYYVKETKVPASTGYIRKDKVRSVKITAGKTASVSITNKPDTGSVTVKKVTVGGGDQDEEFRFILIGKTSGKKYSLKVRSGESAKVSGLPFGKYTLTEDLTEEQQKHYADLTGPQTLTLSKGSATQHVTLERENGFEEDQRLKIVKKTGDGGPVEGFRFLVSWRLYNSRSIDGQTVAEAADPQAELGENQSIGIWQIANPDEIEAINDAAAEGKTGDYEVHLKNWVETEAAEGEKAAGEDDEPAGSGTAGDSTDEAAENAPGEDAGAGGSDAPDGGAGEDGSSAAEKDAPGDTAGAGNTADKDAPGAAEADGAAAPAPMKEQIDIAVRVSLTKAADSDQDPEAEPVKAVAAEGSSGGYRIAYHDIVFAGAAGTGEETVVTDSAGQRVLEGIQPGTYTVTEQMDEKQSTRYRQPDSKTIKVGEGSDETIVFSFWNEPILIPVRLQKTSADGQIEDVEFTLSGTPAYADEPMEDIVVQTGEDGIADFGELYPGSYTVEETGFDSKDYVNTYPMEGKEGPAFTFTITGKELTQEQLDAGECLWLGGDPGQGSASAEKVTFLNRSYVDLWITKVDGVSRSFLPGAEFTLAESDGTLAARFRIDADEDGSPAAVMLASNGKITAEAGENGGTQVFLAAEESGADQETAVQESSSEYPCIALHGLLEGEIYRLTETAAPEGFTPLEEPYIFSVTLGSDGEPQLNTCDEYGKSIAATARRGTLVVVNDAPSIGTTALDSSTGEHISRADGEVTLMDTCSVTNLAKGKTYTMVARLMDKTAYLESGDDSDVKQIHSGGAPVTGLVTFVASGREHTVNVPITLNGSDLAGRSTVVYESLYPGTVTAAQADTQTAAAEEADPENASQTVVFPEIKTTAALTSRGSIRDRVTYENLLPGKRYVMYGRLMNSKTGEEIGGSLTEKRFRADRSGSGTVTVKIACDTRALQDQGIRDLVVFEECSIRITDEDGTEKTETVAVHEDLTDEDQSVHIPGPGVTETGDSFRGVVPLLLLIGSAAGTAIICSRRRSRSRG